MKVHLSTSDKMIKLCFPFHCCNLIKKVEKGNSFVQRKAFVCRQDCCTFLSRSVSQELELLTFWGVFVERVLLVEYKFRECTSTINRLG